MFKYLFPGIILVFFTSLVSSPILGSVASLPSMNITLSTARSTGNFDANYSAEPLAGQYASIPLTEQKSRDNSTSTFKITEKIKSAIQDLVDGNKSNAAIAIGLVDSNGTQFYGYGNLSKSNNDTIDENTFFAIGSTTKVFTTILLADMVKEGLVKLDDPIEKYLPSSITVPSYNGHKITIEDLATHTSGLPEFPDNYCSSFDPEKAAVQDSVEYRTNVFNCTRDYSFDSFYHAISNLRLDREPGSKVEYSTFGIGLLGHILTLKSNMSSFDDLLKQEILDVLGMNDTGFVLSDVQKSKLAVGHFGGEELPPLNFSSPIAPGGGLYSTVGDILKFLSANIGLIKTELDDAMQESHLIRLSTGQVVPNNLKTSHETSDTGSYIGLGWFITTNFGHEIIWHNGGTIGGYNAYMAFNPTTERGIVIVCSTDIADINITTISFNQDSELSALIWDLLNQ